ncbi:MAG: hypothetical protein GKR89_30870 [Candidatus Latescibacteria bacterium]|nr:hypothetical protein [Candidatus Latescibacterota bacterium]
MGAQLHFQGAQLHLGQLAFQLRPTQLFGAQAGIISVPVSQTGGQTVDKKTEGDAGAVNIKPFEAAAEDGKKSAKVPALAAR